ncbi:MAG: hypothetical protein N2167_05070 [Flavobacteriales bacterium]|nr:hypothetical protein [Flavobacteriales bacterium]
MRIILVVLVSMVCSLQLNAQQTSKTSKSSNNHLIDADDIVYTFYNVNEPDFPQLPSQDDQESIKIFYKNLGFWLNNHGENLQLKVNQGILPSFTLKRSAIRNLSEEKNLEFKAFYNSLDSYIQFVENQKVLSKGSILLPDFLFKKLISFFN